ncbi:4-hydroxythreonine-4-phosphate dehydrogenase PdxA [Desulfosediminicola sp.]|uniref:4-hydroxythreonine-4-phosphate dehydrogenase PdxA n=1 Tax=Desulfosediminicola sp. TaxID=2886825 RepID=UPI003AF2DFAC
MTMIGITMGCPAGIGPEILLRYFTEHKVPAGIRPVVLGDRAILNKCAADLGLNAKIVSWQPGDQPATNSIPVFNLSDIPEEEHSWGNPTLTTARAMAGYIEKAVELTLSGVLDGITTCPISKSALHAAGFKYPGHTEMLVDMTGADDYTMMMAGKTLKVTLATIHCSLASVPELLSEEGIYRLIHITHRGLGIDFGLNRPRIAVAGLNPHSSEEGLFGNEEERVIIPAIERARRDGIDVDGPFPPDTVFFKAASGQFDGVVCMYHDQGLIPFKLLHFEDGVNVTLGLPIVRTSVDHGTAYDIAGKGVAAATSLAAAIQMAGDISNNRKQHYQSQKIT